MESSPKKRRVINSDDETETQHEKPQHMDMGDTSAVDVVENFSGDSAEDVPLNALWACSLDMAVWKPFVKSLTGILEAVFFTFNAKKKLLTCCCLSASKTSMIRGQMQLSSAYSSMENMEEFCFKIKLDVLFSGMEILDGSLMLRMHVDKCKDNVIVGKTFSLNPDSNFNVFDFEISTLDYDMDEEMEMSKMILNNNFTCLAEFEVKELKTRVINLAQKSKCEKITVQIQRSETEKKKLDHTTLKFNIPLNDSNVFSQSFNHMVEHNKVVKLTSTVTVDTLFPSGSPFVMAMYGEAAKLKDRPSAESRIIFQHTFFLKEIATFLQHVEEKTEKTVILKFSPKNPLVIHLQFSDQRSFTSFYVSPTQID
jgi:hypothetical protein